MPTIAREIDALGGTGEDSDWGRGYNAALTDAEPITENADALVDELLECITDLLDGQRLLEQWATEARSLVRGVKHRRSI